MSTQYLEHLQAVEPTQTHQGIEGEGVSSQTAISQVASSQVI